MLSTIHQYNIPHDDDRVVSYTMHSTKIVRFGWANATARDGFMLTERPLSAGIFSPYMSKLPDYLDSTSFKNPEDSAENLFRYATGTELDFFDWLHTQPRQLDIFSAAMAASSAHQEGPMTAKVSALFPADDSEHHVLMVDVGGGKAPNSPDGPSNDLGPSKMRLYK